MWASEIIPRTISITKRHFPEMAHVGDITKLSGYELPPVDIITASSPCQDLSIAGKRKGLAGEQSGLFFHAIRIVDEMREKSNGRFPTYFVWENVVGAFSSGNPQGSDFQAVLESLAKTEIPIPKSGRWANAGMVRSDGVNISWRVFNAAYWGVPQRRRRIFLVAGFGAGSSGEVLFIEKGVRRDYAAGGKAREGTAAAAENGAGSAASDAATSFAANQRDKLRLLGDCSGAPQTYPDMEQRTFIAKNCLTPWDTQGSRVFAEDGVSPTLAGADDGGGRNPGGFVAAFMAGQGAKARGIAYSETVSPTLKSGESGTNRMPAIVEPQIARTLAARYDSSPCADRGQNIVTLAVHPTVSGTLLASGAGLDRPAGAASETDLCVAVAYGETGRGFWRGGAQTLRADGGNCPGNPGNAAFFNRQSYDSFKEQNVASAQRSQQYKFQTDLVWKLDEDFKRPDCINYNIRRLTPKECERLQGYVDGYTKYGADGKEISDAQRYRALGNSIAIPCAAFVLEGIKEQIEKHKTDK